MKKGIKSLSLTAIILSVLSFVFVCLIAFVPAFMALFENDSISIFNILTFIQIGTLLNSLTAILLSVLTLVFVSKTKIGIWAEIVLIITKIGILPFLSLLFSFLDSWRMSVIIGQINVGTISTFTILNNIPSVLNGMSTGFVLVVCGMSIVNKIFIKKSLES